MTIMAIALQTNICMYACVYVCVCVCVCVFVCVMDTRQRHTERQGRRHLRQAREGERGGGERQRRVLWRQTEH